MTNLQELLLKPVWQAAPEQFGNARYSVHILPFHVRDGLRLRFRLVGSVLA